MSIAGLKKQVNKVNQLMSEKIGGAKGTELDNDFVEMEKKVDAMAKLVDELIAKIEELLQPNPASRARMVALKSMHKIRGQASQTLYPQPEGQLGECMMKYGRELGSDNLFGQSLVETGESYKQLAEAKYTLEDTVKQNYLEPLHHLKSKDLHEVQHHRKKMTGRRLDYDCKRRKQEKGGTVTDAEVQLAVEKFEEGKQLAEAAMHNVLDNDVEQISELMSFVDAELVYHQHSVSVLESLLDNLKSRCSQASSRPRSEHISKRVVGDHSNGFNRYSSSGNQYSTTEDEYSVPSTVYRSTSSTSDGSRGGQKESPFAEALYDFEAEAEGELNFKEGEMITLLSRIDDNWLEGSVNGKTGYFPASYVKVVVDICE